MINLNIPIIVQRATDMVTVVKIPDNSKTTLDDISAIAAQQLNFPHYTPDNASTTLIFHTESGDYLLGAIRSNPALKEITIEGSSFPQQINASIGGNSPNPKSNFRLAAVETIRKKFFLDPKLSGEGLDAQDTLNTLCETIQDNEGWEESICVHTDKWQEKEGEKTMCVLTAIKHITCEDSYLSKLENALSMIIGIKQKEGLPYTLSPFKFVRLQPLIDNALESYLDDEVAKATKAYNKFGNTISVTFNDLAVATLSKNGAFQTK